MVKHPYNSPQGVLIINDKGIIVLINPTINTLFNYDDEELLDTSVEKLIPGGLPEYQSEEATDSGVEFSALKKGEVQFSVKININQFQAGEETFTVAFITEFIQEEVSGDVMQQPEIIFLILDNVVNIKFINKYGSKMLGCAEETLYGLNWCENFLPEGEGVQWNSYLAKLIANGAIDNFEGQMINSKGEQLSVLWATSIIYNSLGAAVGIFITGFELGKKWVGEADLKHINKINKLNAKLERSVKKQTEKLTNSLINIERINKDLEQQIQIRKEIERKLIKIQGIYDAVVHNFPDGVIGVLNRDMKYVLLDGQELNEIDMPALGLVNQKNGDPHLTNPDREILNKIKMAFEGEVVSFETKSNQKYYHISAVPLQDGENQVNEILCVLKNVTEKNKMERDMQVALEKEVELNELKSRFVTMACHEFKTPLATILSSAFILENYSGKNYAEEKVIHMNRIKRSVNNLTLTLNKFLALEDNPPQVAYSTINLPKFIDELISEMGPAMRIGQSVNYEHSGDEEIQLDAYLLWTIITNLISNAIKYSNTNDQIQLSTNIAENVLTIEGEDVGVGIPEDELDHILGRFYRARNALNFDGTGLGLHIVDKSIQLLKGDISITSKLNEGTKFIVRLPGKDSKRKEPRFAIKEEL